MIYLNMPVGDCYGWAICGKNLLKELSKITEVRYCAEAFPIALRDKETADLVEKTEIRMLGDVKFPFIHTINGECKPHVKYNGIPNIGYMFYEAEVIPPDYVKSLNRNFDVVVGGSKWNEDVLVSNGVKNATSIPQGVDREIFKPLEKTEYKDKFVIFSGGKWEPRKGQDVVVKAVSYLQEKYKDVMLIASWGNLFSQELDSEMREMAMKLLNGKRTVLMPIIPQKSMPEVIRQTDIGVFPNRAEGGTNLALMEYLACGRPVVATMTTGQKDVLDYGYTYSIDPKSELDSTIAGLEEAYRSRTLLPVMGSIASDKMDYFSWQQTANKFFRLCEVSH